MKNENEVSFFRKLVMSIKDFEKYPQLASNGWLKVASYLVKLITIFTIIVSFCVVYDLSNKLQSGLDCIEHDFPEFSFDNDELKMGQDEPIVYENMDNLFNMVVVDTKEMNDEILDGYKQKLQKTNNGIVLLKDKTLVKTQLTNGMIEYSYSTIADKYQIEQFNKAQVLEYFSGTNLIFIYIGIFIMIAIYMFVLYFTSIWLDIVLLGALGYFTALIMRIHLRFSAMCKVAVHSLTLPVLLNAIVVLIETFTSFRIKYFEVMYIGIAYIYIITAILMIKDDIIKNQKELTKIIEEQAKIKLEMEKKRAEEEAEKEEQRRQKEKKEQQKKEKKEQENKDVGDEPQGENA